MAWRRAGVLWSSLAFPGQMRARAVVVVAVVARVGRESEQTGVGTGPGEMNKGEV